MLSADNESVLGQIKMNKNRLASESLQSMRENKMTTQLALHSPKSLGSRGVIREVRYAALWKFEKFESGWIGRAVRGGTQRNLCK